MARIDWIELRLQNWARWVLARRGELGFQSSDTMRAGGTAGYRQAAIPIGDAEASDTDQAIRRLYPGGLALAVHEFYTGQGGVADKAARLCIAESILYRRIDQAHAQLAEHFLAKQDKAKAERARVEALARR